MDEIASSLAEIYKTEKIGNDGAITEYKEFPERTHYTLGQEGWEERPLRILPP